jgi:hypothetical protein
MSAPDDKSIDQTLRAHMEAVLMARVIRDDSRREEALSDYLRVTSVAGSAKQAETLAAMIPPVLPSLYRRWIRMFLDRLFETVPREQIALLCDGTDASAASLTLALLMFLESERMEKQMSADLQAMGASQSGLGDNPQAADAAADFLRSRVADLARKQQEQKGN